MVSNVASLLPPNATLGARAFEQASARIGAVPIQVDTLWNAATCPAALLPWLAWTVGVEVWSSDWPEAQKRAAIAAAPYVKRHKGTRAAVDRALQVIDYPVTLTEWFEATPPVDPFTFSVGIDITGRGALASDLADLLASIEAAKNLRSHLSELDLSADLITNGETAAAAIGALVVEIRPFNLIELDALEPLATGAVAYGFLTTELQPAA